GCVVRAAAATTREDAWLLQDLRDDQDDEDRQHLQRTVGEGGTQVVGVLAVVDFHRQRHVPGGIDDHGRHVLAEALHERQQGASDHAFGHQGEGDRAQGAERARPQILGRLLDGGVDLGERGGRVAKHQRDEADEVGQRQDPQRADEYLTEVERGGRGEGGDDVDADHGAGQSPRQHDHQIQDPAPLPFHRAITQAVSTPTTIEATIATADIWEETSSGRRLRGWVKIATKFCSVYSGGMIWVVQVPFTVKASSRIEATGATRIATITADPTAAPRRG